MFLIFVHFICSKESPKARVENFTSENTALSESDNSDLVGISNIVAKNVESENSVNTVPVNEDQLIGESDSNRETLESKTNVTESFESVVTVVSVVEPESDKKEDLQDQDKIIDKVDVISDKVSSTFNKSEDFLDLSALVAHIPVDLYSPKIDSSLTAEQIAEKRLQLIKEAQLREEEMWQAEQLAFLNKTKSSTKL